MKDEWTEEQLEDLLDAGEGAKVGPEGAYEYAAKVRWGSGRWSSYTMHVVVDTRTSEAFGRVWEAGLTEVQDYRGWQDGWVPMVCREVLSIVWEAV